MDYKAAHPSCFLIHSLTMGNQLLFCTLLALIPALVTSDFLISNIRNIKKRNVANNITDEIDIYSLKIECFVTSRFSHNVITSRAVNRANVSKEALFDVELPKTAFITNFTMTIDGVTYPGTIKEKEAAQQQYQKAVSRGQTAGLVKASGRKTEKFSVSVNIAAASKVTFQLQYEELLKRTFGKYELFLKVNPKQLVNKFEIEANIFEPQGISFLDAEGSFITNDLLPVIHKSFSGKKGHVSFKPTMDQQRTCVDCQTTLLSGDFVIKYDVNRETPGNLQMVNGYFVHFFAPQNVSHLPKNVVFIIDISGSMSGRKIDQTKEALLKILEDIKEEDHFNIVLFESDVVKWNDTLIQATPENLAEARRYVQSIYARGWTNLFGGLITGIEMLKEAQEAGTLPERSASLIMILSDGLPNEGVSSIQEILLRTKNATQGKFPYIILDSDSALQLQDFYNEVANPLLTEVEFKYPENAISDLTQNNFKHYYAGSEIVVAGRIIDNDLNSITAEVKAHGAEQDVTYAEQADVEETAKATEEQKYIFGDFIERLWAYLTIQQLLEKRNVATGDEKTNLTAEILDMSLKYKFVTPLTSMVVTKPEDTVNDTAIADKPLEASRPVIPAYSAPQHYHRYTSVDADPHFIIDVPQKEDALCFNINEEPGVVLNLIRDPTTGISVNGQLIGEKKSSNDVGSIHNTYIGRLGIRNTQLNVKLEITPESITLHNGTKQMMFTWLDEVTLLHPSLTLKIIRKKSLEFSMGEGATFIVVLHQSWSKHAVHPNFLGFYTLDSHRLSGRTHGLLGQFFHPIDFNILEVHPGSDPQKPDATMIVKNNQLTVTRGWQKDYTEDVKHGTNVPCWFIHNNGEGLIDGIYTDYIVPSLF
ncbi:inter-alpha-trypsin inhibitor heavy chain H3-like [Podarcis lilfordi]|uniref:Inter-alpha-trypsin inhibitor heavy chain H3 n=1 Tax=Podarcis lilfordi TaxID=74358 RepID=A0AA35JXS3_9SAUR|nr:inter-alpha-trypsin inhibitor heavy chain H3-like [Podarcis lilfordi]